MCGTLEERSAQYIAGYVTKKMTRFDDPRLNGRHPEFARMSLKPGIGAGAVPDVASVLMKYKLESRGDVPLALRHGSRELPLGRYLRRKLREQVGLDPAAPEHYLEALRTGLLPVFEAAAANTSAPGMAQFRRFAVQSLLEDENRQKALNATAKFRLNHRRDTL